MRRISREIGRAEMANYYSVSGGCAGSLKPTRLSLQFGELQGDLAQLQGTKPSHPAEDPLHLSGLDGFLPNSRSRENHNP